MSEDRSFPPASESKAPTRSGATLLNTNSIIQKVLQKATAEDRGSVVVRCDDLPLVLGSEKDFETIFTTLLEIVLQKRTTRRFLYINCASEDAQTTVAGFKPFNIQFHTDSNPGINWPHLHEEQINQVAALLQKHSANLVVNQLKTGGCIFSISIFGKSL